jgi:hypothetical protein
MAGMGMAQWDGPPPSFAMFAVMGCVIAFMVFISWLIFCLVEKCDKRCKKKNKLSEEEKGITSKHGTLRVGYEPLLGGGSDSEEA